MTNLREIIPAGPLRFGIVAVIGLAIDFCSAWMLARWGGLPLPVAAAIGFALGACVNYLLHELWSFGAGNVSGQRSAKYFLVLALVFGARVGTVAVLGSWTSTAAALVVAVGVSFVINYLFSRKLVFDRETRT